MLRADQAAAKTAMAQPMASNRPELEIIEHRITGAANAGFTSVDVVLEGPAVDEVTAEKIKQYLLDHGYQVNLVWARGYKFTISW